MADGHKVNAMIICDAEDQDSAVLTLTENGFGKRTLLSEYNVQGRGGQGVISIQTSERNGDSVGAILVEDHDEAMLITNGGTLVRTRVAEVSIIGRNTQGVKIIGVSENEQLISIEKVAESDEDEEVGSEGDAVDEAQSETVANPDNVESESTEGADNDPEEDGGDE